MTIARNLSLVGAIVALLGLSACGNEPGRGEVLGPAKARLQQLLKQGAPSGAQPSGDPVAAALAAVDKPLVQFYVEARNARVVMLQIESNGSYETWATSDRRSITLRHGFLTATRGVGEDLMSSEDSASEALVLARKPGQAQRIQRFLTAEGTTREIVATCTISRGAERPYALGEISTTTLVMNESCVAPDARFDNSYQVDKRGRVVSARQWLSPLNGYVIVSRMRY